MKKPGIGLIGCGTWGSVHARTYAASPFVRLIAISDQDADRAAAAARNYGAEKHSADWRDLLADAEIDAVAIATPGFAHGEIVQAAIELFSGVQLDPVSRCDRAAHKAASRGQGASEGSAGGCACHRCLHLHLGIVLPFPRVGFPLHHTKRVSVFCRHADCVDRRHLLETSECPGRVLCFSRKRHSADHLPRHTVYRSHLRRLA